MAFTETTGTRGSDLTSHSSNPDRLRMLWSCVCVCRGGGRLKVLSVSSLEEADN